MGRGSIENNTSRWQQELVTVCKHRNGLLAAVLCYVFSICGCRYGRVRQQQLRSPGLGGRTTEYNTSRQVTLCNGLLNKAYDVLCNAVVAITTVIFSCRGRLHECANHRFINLLLYYSSDKKMVKLLIVTAIFVGTHLAPVKSSSTIAYWDFFCAGGNFTPSSTYARSLANIAVELPKRAASTSLLFADSRSGEVHAIAQCRGDSSASACARCTARCLRDATNFLCPFKKGAVVFSETCSVAYYHKEILQYPTGNELDLTATMNDFSPVVLRSATFNTSVRELTEAVARRTSISPTHFGTGQKEVVQEEYKVTIYGLGQCLPNLSAEDCQICLRDLIDTIDIAIDMTTGRVARVWCNYRFALYKFFRGKPDLDLPAKGLPKKRGKKHQNDDNRTMLVSLVVVFGTLLLLSVVAGVIYWWRIRNQQRKPSGKEVRCTGKAVEVESQPSALDSFERIVQMANKKEIALFLDYDGTLAPIVRDPERAYISNEMRGVLQNVANLFRTSIVTGRDIEKVFDFVRIKNISCAGCHGTDIMIASTSEIEELYQPAEKYVDMINEVHNFLVNATGEINGTYIEHKKYCVSLHYRNVAEEDLPRVDRVVDEIKKKKKDQIEHIKGHMVHEFGPPISWNKGTAVLFMLEKFGEPFPIYIGDDQTDENVFKVLRERKNGIGILVAETVRETSAYYSLKDPAQVMDFLKMLVNWKNETQDQ